MTLALISSLCGFTAVALGAFGAHGLKDKLSTHALGWWETGTLYLLVHAGVALAVALSAREGSLRSGGYAMIFGAMIFAGTLYAMALGAPRWFGAITPIGGLGMLIGWGLIALSALQSTVD